MNANEFYSREEKDEMADELRDQEAMILAAEKSGHYAVDAGYCACGLLCETGTRLRRHQESVVRGGTKGDRG